MTTRAPLIWIVGDASRAEMRELLDESLRDGGRPVQLADVAAVEAKLANGAVLPDLVIVCQSWPDEFPVDHITRLLAAVPLARVLCASGCWCESSGRTRPHWPPALRVPVWAARQRIEHELAILSGNRAAFPPTATRDEVLLRLVLSPPSAGERARVRGQARVEIVDAAFAQTIIDELQRHGWTTTDDRATTVDVVVLQADPISDEVSEQIGERCRKVAPAAVLAVTAWPLAQWCEQLRAAGVCEIVSALDFRWRVTPRPV